MSATVPLPDLQRVATQLERAVEVSAFKLTSPTAQRRAFRAQAQLRGAVLELGAAIALEAAPAASAPADDALLVEVISPGAERADAIVSSIARLVDVMSPWAAEVHLSLGHDADGRLQTAEIMRRNGWRQDDVGWWHRPGHGAAAGVTLEQPR